MPNKILIVDDEAAVCGLLSHILVQAGYVCQSALNVSSAKEILSDDRFDLMLTDLKMPGESGIELIRYAKEHFPNMGRVIISSSDSQEDSAKFIEIGVYGYVLKPVTKNEVLITVENALKHLRNNQQLETDKNILAIEVTTQYEMIMAIMNNLNVGVAMFAPDLTVLEFNKRMQQWFPQLRIGLKAICCQTDYSRTHKSRCNNCAIQGTFSNSTTMESTLSLVTTLGERDFRVVTTPIFNNSSTVYAGIALYEDITEHLLLEKKLQQAQKLEIVGQLAAGIAHEIKTPTQYIGDNIRFFFDAFQDIANLFSQYDDVIKTASDRGLLAPEFLAKLSAIRETADLEYLMEEIPKALDQSIEGVERIEKIVRAMKEFSHPGNEEKSATDINKLLQTTATVCRNEWKYIADLETDFAEDLPLVSCYQSDISQVFLNIIVNAAHAIESLVGTGSSKKGRISIRTLCSDKKVCIRISDTGGGIPTAYHNRIFEPFFTTKQLGKGTGQGLAIARRMVIEKHHGILFFETEPNVGTTFVIELPAA